MRVFAIAAALVVTPDGDVRAVLGTILAGLAGGLLLAIVNDRRPR